MRAKCSNVRPTSGPIGGLKAAGAWLEVGAADRALGCANQALTIEPDTRVHILRAEALGRLGSVEPAMEALAGGLGDHIEAIDGIEDPDAVTARAAIELCRDPAAAIEHARRAVAASSQRRRAWRILLAAKAVRQERALDEATQAAGLWPADRAFQLRLGIEQRLTGDVDAAAGTFVRLLAAVPQHRAARVQLLECQSALPKLRRKMHMSRFAADVQQWWSYLSGETDRAADAPSMLGDAAACHCDTAVKAIGDLALRYARLHLASRHERRGSLLLQCPLRGRWWHGHIRAVQLQPAIARIEEVPAGSDRSVTAYL